MHFPERVVGRAFDPRPELSWLLVEKDLFECEESACIRRFSGNPLNLLLELQHLAPMLDRE
jgi:hypothetical protein